MHEKKEKNNKKKNIWKTIAIFIGFEFIFTAITGPFVLLYGPFENAKRIYVGTAMKTMNHQFLATLFLSKERIDKILADNSSPKVADTSTANATTNEDVQEDMNKVKIPTKKDDTIILHKVEAKKFDGYMLEVKDPTRVKVGYSGKLGTEGQRTSEIAKDKDAVAAINGGGFTDRSQDSNRLWVGTGAFAEGLLMSEGKVISGDVNSASYVMGLTDKGRLIVGRHNVSDLKNLGVVDAISFDPPLVINGKPYASGEQGLNPRTAIGQKEDGTMLLLVVDGRQGLKMGASIAEIQELMLQYGAVNATNLDGGSSTTMYYDGDVVNSPCDPLGERSVATAVYVK